MAEAQLSQDCPDNTLCFYEKFDCQGPPHSPLAPESLSESELPCQDLPFASGANSVCNNWNRLITVYSKKGCTGDPQTIEAGTGCVNLKSPAFSVMFSSVGPNDYKITERTKAHKLPHGYPQCVSYERETVHDILKEGYVCHVGFDYTEKDPQGPDDTHPVVLPTLYGIDTTNPDLLYLHSSTDARLYQTACNKTAYPNGVPVCLTVSLVDHLAVGEHAFWNGVYYRSVMAYGNVSPVLNEGEKMQALKSLVEHIFKGRWNDTEQPDKIGDEFTSVGVLSLALEQVSAKVQDGTKKINYIDGKRYHKGVEYKEDVSPKYWAGVIPVCQGYAAPQPSDETIKAGIEIPKYLKGYNRPQAWPIEIFIIPPPPGSA